MTAKQYGELITQKRGEAAAIYDKYFDPATGAQRDGVDISAEDLAKLDGENGLNAEIRTLEAKQKEAETFEANARANAEALRASTTVTSTLPHPIDARTATRGMQFSGDVTFSTAGQRRGGQLRAFTAERNGNSRERAEGLAHAFGRWALGCLGHRASQQWCEDNGVGAQDAQMRTMVEGNGVLGGFTVPSEFEATLIDLKEEYGVFPKYTNVIPMSRDTITHPRRTGGLTAYWPGESGTITQSDAAFDQVSLVAKKIAAIAKMSSELSEDSVLNMGDHLANEMGYAFAVAIDNAGFIGDGTSTYGGITGAARKLRDVSATRANIAGLVVASGAISTITLANLHTVKSRLPVYAQKRAAWFVHNAVYADVFERLALDAGGTTAESIINGAATQRFLGYPVVLVPSLPSTTATDTVVALLGDLSLASMMGDRRQTTVAFGDQALNAFEKDEIVVRATQRLDIVVHDVGNASATEASRVPGPIVGIATAA